MALLHLETKRIYALNESGAFIWKRLQRGLSAQRIAAAMSRRFSISRRRARQDLRSWLALLRQKQLLHASFRPEKNEGAALAPSLGSPPKKRA